MTVAAWPLLPTLHLLTVVGENNLNDSEYVVLLIPDKGRNGRVRGSGERRAGRLSGGLDAGFREGVAVALQLICQEEFR